VSRTDLVGSAIMVLAVFATATLGGLSTADSVSTWYPTLAKPSWNPPDWVFGPVWGVLYVLIAFAGILLWRRRQIPGAKLALAFYAVQLLANGLWSYLFFGLRRPEWALGDIAVMLLAIAGTILAGWRLSRTAAGLLVPYLLWVAFATALNAAIVARN
jgi:translocator protein